MKKFAVIQKDRTILVKTPNPYIVDTYRDADDEELDDVRYRLNESVKFLNDCLRVLGISKKEAREKNYTLNMSTGDEFRRLMVHSHSISIEVWKMITQYDW